MKWVLGRKKIMYQIYQPESSKLLILEFDFAQIWCVHFIADLMFPVVYNSKIHHHT
jgi:hypothetical protein